MTNTDSRMTPRFRLSALTSAWRTYVDSVVGRLFPSRTAAAPTLRPVFDISLRDRVPGRRITGIAIVNTSAVDALGVTIAPIELGIDITLVMKADQVTIRAHSTVAIDLCERTSRVLADPIVRDVDIVERLEHVSVVSVTGKQLTDGDAATRSWPMRVTWRNREGRVFRGNWTLIHETRARRARLVDAAVPSASMPQAAAQLPHVPLAAPAGEPAAELPEALPPRVPRAVPLATKAPQLILERIDEVERKLRLLDASLQEEMKMPFFKRRYVVCHFLFIERSRHTAMLQELKWTLIDAA